MQEYYSAPGVSDHDIGVVVESEAFYSTSNSYKVYIWSNANLPELKRSVSV